MSDNLSAAETPLVEAAVEQAVGESVRGAIEAAKHPSAAVVDRWYFDHFNNLPIGWEDTMRGPLHAAVQDLKARLEKA